MRPGALRLEIGQREVLIQADGGRAAWRAETMQVVCDFSAADGFRRDALTQMPQCRFRPLGRLSRMEGLQRAETPTQEEYRP